MTFLVSGSVQIKRINRYFSREMLLFAAGLCFFVAYVAPNHETPWQTFHIEISAAFGGMFLVLFATCCEPYKSGRVPGAIIALLLIALLPLVQYWTGLVSYRGDAVLASMYIASAAIFVWVGFVTFGGKSSNILKVLAIAMTWSAILSTGMALYQKIHQSGLGIFILDPGVDGRTAANLGQPNHFASLLMLGLASVFWLKEQGKLGRSTTTVASAFLVLGVALSGSRQPLLGVVLLGAWSIRADSLRKVSLLQWFGFGALLVWFVVAFWGVGHLADFQDVAAPISENYRLKVGLRPLMWDQFAHAIANSPWLGYGWQGGLTAQATVAIQNPGLEFSQYSHDIFIDLIVWNGIPLGLGLVAMTVIWYCRIGRCVRNRGGWFEFAIVSFTVAHSMLEYSFAYTYFLIPAALAAGQLEGRSYIKAWRMPLWCMPTLAAVLVLSSGLVIVDYISLADERRDLIMWKARIGGDHPPPVQSSPWLLDQLAASIEWIRKNPTPGMTPEQINEQITLSRRYPTVALLTRTAMVLALNDRTDPAYTELLRLRGLHGDFFYQMAVKEIRGLADTSQPKLRRLMAKIDKNASELLPLPVFSDEVSAHRFR